MPQLAFLQQQSPVGIEWRKKKQARKPTAEPMGLRLVLWNGLA
jgi:hypothetical protein